MRRFTIRTPQPNSGPSWTVQETDAAVATGRVPICRWCGVPIYRDYQGYWVHQTGAYSCRGEADWLTTTAQPHANS